MKKCISAFKLRLPLAASSLAACIFLFAANVTMAQAPQGIPYQALARNSSGVILVSQPISVRFTVHDATAGGTILYQETFHPTTTAQGLFNVNVGAGTVATGTFSSISWGTNAKYLQVELDPMGGASYTDMGTTQMMSVPYSLYSNNGIPAGNYTGDMLYWNGSAWVHVAAGSNGQALVLSSGVPAWVGTTHNIGDAYGGGKVAYILQPGDPGYDPLVQHGLIAATSDQSTGIQWYNGSYTTTNALGTGIGSGRWNTMLIIANQGAGSYAAAICNSYTGGGYTDWYLPSLNELNELYINQAAIGGFFATFYWSSSEYLSSVAWGENFYNGGQGGDSKGANGDVRAVRAF